VLKLTDFGLAGVLSAARSARSGAGTVVGTPAYIAPERVTGEALAPASDVYSAAVVLYELLAGRLPFPAAADPLAQLYQHVYEVPQPLTEVAPEVPPPLARVVMRALQKLQATGVAVMDAHCLASGPSARELSPARRCAPLAAEGLPPRPADSRHRATPTAPGRDTDPALARR
jgi:serine/threonine protein kinase